MHLRDGPGLAPSDPGRVDAAARIVSSEAAPAPFEPAAAPVAGARARRLRPEIQALRAAAVALVLLFHGWPKLVPGGYIGVDVFFVISGYLITKNLLVEVAALLPALETVAEQHHWRIDVASKNACHWTANTQRSMSEQSIRTCVRWKERLNQKLSAEPPYDAILVTHRAGVFLPDAAPGEDRETTIVRGLVESWKTQSERGTRIIAIRDNPSATRQTVACVARHRLRANEYCSLERARALGAVDPYAAATRALPGSSLIDLSELYCDAQTCAVVIGNVVVYRDDNHITRTFARTLARRLGEELERILG